MPFTIITLRKAVPSLRGDLSKWMQEIATGVYVGNFNSKIREELWERVKESIGNGEATLSYACRNEIGYNFETTNTERQVYNFEGIPLVYFPKKINDKETNTPKNNYSNASKMHKARNFQRVKVRESINKYVIIDIETDGLNFRENKIIEIGALKVEGEKTNQLHRLIKVERELSNQISSLTGITMELLEMKGVDLSDAINDFLDFIGENILVGYNINFDISFINNSLNQLKRTPLNNRNLDIQAIVKKEQPFLESYSLQNVLESYGVGGIVPHRALEDAQLIQKLINKVNNFVDYIN